MISGAVNYTLLSRLYCSLDFRSEVPAVKRTSICATDIVSGAVPIVRTGIHAVGTGTALASATVVDCNLAVDVSDAASLFLRNDYGLTY